MRTKFFSTTNSFLWNSKEFSNFKSNIQSKVSLQSAIDSSNSLYKLVLYNKTLSSEEQFNDSKQKWKTIYVFLL